MTPAARATLQDKKEAKTIKGIMSREMKQRGDACSTLTSVGRFRPIQDVPRKKIIRREGRLIPIVIPQQRPCCHQSRSWILSLLVHVNVASELPVATPNKSEVSPLSLRPRGKFCEWEPLNAASSSGVDLNLKSDVLQQPLTVTVAFEH